MKKDEELSKEIYEVARRKGTEAPFSGKYWDSHEKGMYKCAICGTELFSSDTKFDSGNKLAPYEAEARCVPSRLRSGLAQLHRTEEPREYRIKTKL